MRRFHTVVQALVLAAAAALAVCEPAGAATAPRPTAVDIEIAVDTTGSMGPSIAKARTEATSLVQQVHALLPGARFAVVEFRDSNFAYEYVLRQPMTSDAAAVQRALDGLQAAPEALGDYPEAYNLVFHQSVADPATGWRDGARKFVLVVGDAEPHGAGTAGVPGCSDTSADPHGFNTATELAGMRAAGRTLLMIRQRATASTVLACYQGLASLAYAGGAAMDDDNGDLAGPIVDALQRAFPGVSGRLDHRVLRAGAIGGLTLSLRNPNPFPVTLRRLRVGLPRGWRFVHGSATGFTHADATGSAAVQWAAATTVPAGQTLKLHVRVRTARHPGRYGVTAQAQLAMPDGGVVTPSLRAPLRASLVARGHAVGFTLVTLSSALAARASHGGALPQLRGDGSLTLSRSGLARGVVRETVGHARLVLRTTAVHVIGLGSPSVLRLDVRVAARSHTACAVGALGSVTLTDSDTLFGGLTSDRIAVRLAGASCARFTAVLRNGAAGHVATRVSLR